MNVVRDQILSGNGRMRCAYLCCVAGVCSSMRESIFKQVGFLWLCKGFATTCCLTTCFQVFLQMRASKLHVVSQLWRSIDDLLIGSCCCRPHQHRWTLIDLRSNSFCTLEATPTKQGKRIYIYIYIYIYLYIHIIYIFIYIFIYILRLRPCRQPLCRQAIVNLFPGGAGTTFMLTGWSVACWKEWLSDRNLDLALFRHRRRIKSRLQLGFHIGVR